MAASSLGTGSLEGEKQQSKCWGTADNLLVMLGSCIFLPLLSPSSLSLPTHTLPFRYCSKRGTSVAHAAPKALWILPWRACSSCKAATARSPLV